MLRNCTSTGLRLFFAGTLPSRTVPLGIFGNVCTLPGLPHHHTVRMGYGRRTGGFSKLVLLISGFIHLNHIDELMSSFREYWPSQVFLQTVLINYKFKFKCDYKSGSPKYKLSCCIKVLVIIDVTVVYILH